MKSFLTSATSPPSAESTPGAVGIRTWRMPNSRARKQPSIGPAPPNASSVKSRGSMPWREASLPTSRYMPETATWMMASAACSRPRPSFAAIVADGGARLLDIDGDRVVADVAVADDAADGEGIGHGGPRAAAAVAGGTGRRARALGPDRQHAELADRGDRTAAVADRASPKRSGCRSGTRPPFRPMP